MFFFFLAVDRPGFRARERSDQTPRVRNTNEDDAVIKQQHLQKGGTDRWTLLNKSPMETKDRVGCFFFLSLFF